MRPTGLERLSDSCVAECGVRSISGCPKVIRPRFVHLAFLFQLVNLVFGLRLVDADLLSAFDDYVGGCALIVLVLDVGDDAFEVLDAVALSLRLAVSTTSASNSPVSGSTPISFRQESAMSTARSASLRRRYQTAEFERTPRQAGRALPVSGR